MTGTIHFIRDLTRRYGRALSNLVAQPDGPIVIEEEDEWLSVCCGAPENPEVESFCSACNEGTGFEK